MKDLIKCLSEFGRAYNSCKLTLHVTTVKDQTYRPIKEMLKMKQIKMKLKSVLLITALSASIATFAQNPIFSQRYTADPTGLEVNGELFLWTSHDLNNQKRYFMDDITCISSKDLKNWTDHGEVFKVPENMPWVTQAWAPSVVSKNGKFYLYTGDGNRSVNVSVSDKPTGPFIGVGGKPLITKETPNANVEWCYDPTVFIDDDGQAYCVFGGGFAKPNAEGIKPINGRIIKLGADLVSTVGAAVTIDAPGFFEGGYIHYRKINGVKKYYFSYFATKNGMDIDYMMSDNPMTGWEYKGSILKQPKENYNNSHASVFSFKDKWYIAYHTRKIATDRKIPEALALRQRSVAIDELTYNADYTIKPIIGSEGGPAQTGFLNPFEKVEAETINLQSYLLPGIQTDSCKDEGKGRMVVEINNGDWIRVKGADFGSKAKADEFKARISSVKEGGSIEIRLGSEKGELLGICKVPSTGSLENWKTVECNIKKTKGVHDIVLVFKGGEGDLFNFNWWKLDK